MYLVYSRGEENPGHLEACFSYLPVGVPIYVKAGGFWIAMNEFCRFSKIKL